jgi:cell division protein FtsB
MSQPQRQIFGWIVGGLVAVLLFGNQGFRQLLSNWREKKRLDKALVSLESEHERLTRELTWIQQDPSYTEYLIRKNLGYVKKAEIEYRFIKPPKGSARTDLKTQKPAPRHGRLYREFLSLLS